MRNGRLPFPSQFADITMAECDQRIADLSRQHVEEINRYWATLSVRSDDAPAVNARGMQYDLYLAKARRAAFQASVLTTAQQDEWRAWAQENGLDNDSAPREGSLAAVIEQENGYLVVHRFDSPTFAGALVDDIQGGQGPSWFIEPMFWRYEGGHEETRGDFYLVTEYDLDLEVIQPAELDAEAMDYVRETALSMEVLLAGRDLTFDGCTLPLPQFQSSVAALLLDLQEERSRLFSAGMPSEEHLIARRVVAEAYRAKKAPIQEQIRALEKQLRTLHAEEQEALIALKEVQLCVSRGQTLQHRFTGQTGTIFGDRDELFVQIEGSRPVRVEDEIFRGEWLNISEPEPECLAPSPE
ncbi:hypothetical protein ACUDPO_33970 (plasmid) [Pseudomonas aeruginosa]|uniref:hypothetical protein n=1 Tax=Pseudomonas aeruginosa TaxID=287 RepID=UPI001CBB9E16|nr:hypothetical protein [Pseudomonas aeruginosa]MBZ3677556.1 hypothetical protein [Pseudomonas aeruginosa]MBZ3688551.1 hypothetical protein [Pseudomonas aeruginosa]